MNPINKLLSKPFWLTAIEQGALPKKRSGKPHCVVLSRDCYKEIVRNYKASFSDLWRLIRNELKVLAPAEGKVLWRIINNQAGDYTVSYAVLDENSQKKLPRGLSIIWPETWLLQKVLQKETLYKISSGQQYWAWLRPDGVLHLTPCQGLMYNKQFFLDAIGIAKSADEQLLNVPQHLAEQGAPFSWRDIPGQMLVHGAASLNMAAVNWLQLVKGGSTVLLSYILLSSAWLSWQRNYYETELTQLQAQVATVFETQQQLEQQAQQLAHYQQILQRFPASTLVLSALASDIDDIARLDSIQSSGRLVQISGVSSSATQVLANLMSSGNWVEVRFDRNVQRVRNEERFSISMVYQEATDAAED